MSAPVITSRISGASSTPTPSAYLYDPHSGDWLLDAAAGGGGIWDFLVDGATAPISGTAYTSSGLVHTARIDGSGNVLVDLERTGAVDASVQFSVPVLNCIPPCFWPSLMAWDSMTAASISGAPAPEINHVAVYDINDVRGAGADFFKAEQLTAAGQFRITYRMEGAGLTFTAGSSLAPLGATTQVALQCTPTQYLIKASNNPAATKPAGMHYISNTANNQRWYSRQSFDPAADPIQFIFGVSLITADGRATFSWNRLAAMLYGLPE
jgi:hypothetical protein